MGNTNFPQEFVGRWVSSGGDPPTVLVISRNGGITYAAQRDGGSIQMTGMKLTYDEQTKTAAYKCGCCCACCDLVCEYPVRDQARANIRTMKCNGFTLVAESDVVSAAMTRQVVQVQQQAALANAMTNQQQVLMAQQMEIQKLQLALAQQQMGGQPQGQQQQFMQPVIMVPANVAPVNTATNANGTEGAAPPAY